MSRTSYSLRHTYICFRLMEGADIYQIAKNCRTSVEMIEKFYAAHIKTMLDATAINVRKGVIQQERKPRRRARRRDPNGLKNREGGKNIRPEGAEDARTRAKSGLTRIEKFSLAENRVTAITYSKRAWRNW